MPLALKAASALLAVLSSFLIVSPAVAEVQLISFIATADEDFVTLDWTTRGEVGNEGFYVQRSTAQNTGYTRIGEFIEGMVDYPFEMDYFYDDLEVDIGITYWYRLEMVDTDGTSQLSNPISATPGVTSTPTLPGTQATATLTATTAGTETSTVDQAYPPPGFSTATQSGYPGPASAPPPVGTTVPTTQLPVSSTLAPTLALTQVPSPGTTLVLTSTGSLTSTATLVPLPEITMIFPQPREAALLVTATPEVTDGPPPWKTPQRIVPLALVFLIWVILGGWFYFSQRNLG